MPDKISQPKEGVSLAGPDVQTATTEAMERVMALYEQARSELEHVQRQFQEFAYVVSHDLRAPVRAIKTVAEWVLQDYADRLDQEGKEQLAILSDRADRLNAMIEAVLEYSRIGRITEPTVAVDLNELIQDIISHLSLPCGITIKTDANLPIIQAEPKRIRQVFEHLITNAVHAIDKAEGLVSIAAEEQDTFWHLTVTDNGCGIRQQDIEKIFKLFHTLKPRDLSSSLGAGLALTKKIVEVVGGRIWVDSDPGSGSTFHVQWPKTPVKPWACMADMCGLSTDLGKTALVKDQEKG